MPTADTLSAPQSAAPSLIDARPALPVCTANESLWDRAARRRDGIAGEIEAFFESRGIRAWVRKSKPGEYPSFVMVDCWMPAGETQTTAHVDRSNLEISLRVAPHLESPLVYHVALRRHAKTFSAEHWEFSTHELGELLTYLLDGGEKPSFFKSRVPLSMHLLGLVIPGVANEPKNELIKEARPNWFSPSKLIMGCAALLAAFLAGIAEDSDGQFLAGWIMTAAAVVAFIVYKRQPVLQAIPKQSLRCPRREFRVDSWQVSVPGAGEDFASFKARIYAAASNQDSRIDRAIEIHQNATPRGFEERERLVLGSGQATLHVHVYAFGNDAYVGWESYLNWHRWAEGGVVSRTSRDSRIIEYKALGVGVHLPTDFDLIEANVLAETTHRHLVEEIKGFLKERQLEADLDFKIIRGDRSKALQEGKDTKPVKGA